MIQYWAQQLAELLRQPPLLKTETKNNLKSAWKNSQYIFVRHSFSNGIKLQYRMFSVVFMKDIATHLMILLMTSIPLKAYGTPESLLLQADHNRDKLCISMLALQCPQRRGKWYHEDMKRIQGFHPFILLFYCSPKAKVGFSQRESIHHSWEEGASMSSSASPAVLAVKYILDWEVLQLLIDAQPQ